MRLVRGLIALFIITLPCYGQQPQTTADALKQIKEQGARFDSPVFETPYRENLSEEEKIAGLSRLWSEAKFNFAYFDRLPTLDWDALYLEYLPKVRQTKSTLEYYLLLQQMSARLKDGHSGIAPPRELTDAAFASLPLLVAPVEDKVLVLGVPDDLRREGVVPGLELVAVDGVPVSERAQKIMPYISASTEHDLISRAHRFLLFAGAKDSLAELTLRDAGGNTFKKSLRRMGLPDLQTMRPPSFEFKVLDGNVGYVAINTFMDDQVPQLFDEAFDRIAKTDALIIDLRNNGGGNGGLGFRVLSYLTDKPFKTGSWTTRDYRPAFRAWGRPQETYGESDEEKPHGSKLYSKPVVVLTSARTYSASEDFTMTFAHMKRGLIVGEPTGGSTGQPLMFKLPGGGFGYVVTKRDTFPGGKEFVGLGIQPDVLVRPTVADVLAGRDTVLNAALAEIKKGTGALSK